MGGAARYDIKASAGWTRTRRDGSAYSRGTDIVADEAEAWFTEAYGGIRDTRVLLSGDDGYDIVLTHRGHSIKVDVIHAGLLKDGSPRAAAGSWVIVNPAHGKLSHSDVLVYIAGPPFEVHGAIPTSGFVRTAQRKDFGFGEKLAVPARALAPLARVLDAVVRRREVVRAPHVDEIRW